MLAYKWRELEDLGERICALRERLEAARKTGNTGLVEGLGAEINRAVRQRDRLVRHISTRLGSTAGRDALPDPPFAESGRRTGCDAVSMPARD